MKKGQFWFIAILIVFLTSLGCNLPSMVSTPVPTVVVSTQAVGDLQQKVQEAVDQAVQTGSLTLEVTESQLTSALALSLQNKGDFPVSNLEVRLQDGKIQIGGTASQNGMELPAKITVTVSVIACKTEMAIESASIGPLPLPKEQLNSLIPMAEQTLTDLIASSSVPNLCLTSVVIGDGKMTVNGTTTP